MRQKRRKFSPEFKEEAVKAVILNSRPVVQVARELDVHEGTLGKALLTFLWVPFHDRPGSGGQRPPRVRSAMAISASGLW